MAPKRACKYKYDYKYKYSGLGCPKQRGFLAALKPWVCLSEYRYPRDNLCLLIHDRIASPRQVSQDYGDNFAAQQ